MVEGISLTLQNISAGYGKSRVLDNVSLSVGSGEVVALLGANGAGKTTLLNLICGFLRPTSGDVSFGGKSIVDCKPYEVFRKGVIQVSQTRDLFPDLSVLDNLELGATARKGSHRDDLAQVLEYFPRLRERSKQRCGTLSGGELQMVAIGRALLGAPKVLLLDEPSGGLAPRFVHEIAEIMKALKDRGSTMMIVEQNMALALGVADRFYVLRDGSIRHTGTPAEVGENYAEIAQRYYL